jgi:plasmid stabilization system protein ParE
VIKVIPTSKAMSDLGVIVEHVKRFNDAATARLGEDLDGYYGPPAREVHRWVCLAGRYELHYEVLPPYAEEPTTIAILPVWDTRQDR